jgi:hypothetical protein
VSFLAGMLVLVALDAVTSSQAAAGRFSGALSIIPRLVAWVVDPTVPAIPDRTKKAA